MDTTPNLTLPYIMAAQAQKHVTHNEAIRTLDALVQLMVADKDLATPPASPAEGARYIVAAAATGAWSGQAGRVAAWQDGAWAFYVPVEGFVAWVADEDKLYAFDGAAWGAVATGGGGGGSVNPTPLVGVNATADTTNRLSVAAPATLFNHDGTDHRLKINKSAAASTASLLYQSAFSGRAEFGLTGDDNLHLKVSADGTTWKEALVVDRTSGAVSLPFTAPAVINQNLLINGDFHINQRAFAFGALADGVYGVDRWKAAGATNIGWDGATSTLTINAGAIRQVVEPGQFGFVNLANQQVTVSVEGLTGGNLTVGVGSASGVITPGSGRRSVTLTLGAGDTGTLTVTLTPSSYPAWFKRAKLEAGATASDWQARAATVERQLCRRYFQTTYADGMPGGSVTSAGTMQCIVSLSVTTQGFRWPFGPMRAAPTLTIWNAAGTLGQGSSFNGNGPKALTPNSISTQGVWYFGGSGMSVGDFYDIHFHASAEF